GYLEVLSIDAQPPDAVALPILVVSAVAWDVPLQGQLRQLLGPADPSLLARAARSGLRDDDLARAFYQLIDLALDAAERIGVDAYGRYWSARGRRRRYGRRRRLLLANDASSASRTRPRRSRS